MDSIVTQELVRELFEYRDGRLYWKANRACNKVKAGDRAGWKKHGEPYWQITINWKKYREHRIIYLYVRGFIPTNIDHINEELTSEGIFSNKIDNLRPITKSANGQRTRKITGTSKYKGVSWSKGMKKWLAQACFHYKTIPLGFYNDEIEAAKAYDKFIIEHYDRHAYLNFPELRGELSA